MRKPKENMTEEKPEKPAKMEVVGATETGRKKYAVYLYGTKIYIGSEAMMYCLMCDINIAIERKENKNAPKQK